MKNFKKLFAELEITEPDLKKEMIECGVELSVPKDTHIVEQGRYIKWLAFVIEGRVKVWQETDERRILLYHVNPIETCVLSLAAAFKDFKSEINAATEEEAVIIKFPIEEVREWSFQFRSWHKLTINAFIFSYDELLSIFKDVVFKKINERLMEYLKTEANNNFRSINITHKKLAEEIGTTREVVSKILKQFEMDGKLKLDFKKITLSREVFN